MAAPHMLTPSTHDASPQRIHLRISDPDFTALKEVVFQRYPAWEWATFARFGWRETSNALVVSLAALDPPTAGDLNHNVGHVAIDEQYTLRVALQAEKHPLAVGVVHSHPRDGAPRPSHIDDDMDRYYARYLSDFARNRPYVSLILSIVQGELVISGRAFWRDRWLILDYTAGIHEQITTWPGGHPARVPVPDQARAARVAAAFGEQALRKLKGSAVAVIGTGGTGSAAVETLARAGIGRLILVDPDVIEPSNLERVHGSYPPDAANSIPKVLVASRHVKAIDPSIVVEPILGRLPQRQVIDAVVSADVMLGCTDQQHSRLALSDLAFRYLVPAIDCGVTMEGSDGHVTGQIAQIVRFLPTDPCALCRNMIAPQRIGQELMSKEDSIQRQLAANQARARGEDPNPYWRHQPQINTVGYLTTTVGAMVAGYAIGWLTGRFDPPFERLQMNLVAKYLDVTDVTVHRRSDCACNRFRGWADQAVADSLITAPEHWPNEQLLAAN